MIWGLFLPEPIEKCTSKGPVSFRQKAGPRLPVAPCAVPPRGENFPLFFPLTDW